MSSKLYILFCIVALFNTIYSNPRRCPGSSAAMRIDEDGLCQSEETRWGLRHAAQSPASGTTRWNEDGSNDWKPNPPVSIKPPLVPPGEPDVPNCVVSIDHGVYFNNCTNEPSVIVS
jgi:hypothetical protein